MAAEGRGLAGRGWAPARRDGGVRPVTPVRIWLMLTAALLAAVLLWALAPLLVFLALLTAALGIVAALVIALARALRAWRGERGGDAASATAESSEDGRVPRDQAQ